MKGQKHALILLGGFLSAIALAGCGRGGGGASLPVIPKDQAQSEATKRAVFSATSAGNNQSNRPDSSSVQVSSLAHSSAGLAHRFSLNKSGGAREWSLSSSDFTQLADPRLFTGYSQSVRYPGNNQLKVNFYVADVRTSIEVTQREFEQGETIDIISEVPLSTIAYFGSVEYDARVVEQGTDEDGNQTDITRYGTLHCLARSSTPCSLESNTIGEGRWIFAYESPYLVEREDLSPGWLAGGVYSYTPSEVRQIRDIEIGAYAVADDPFDSNSVVLLAGGSYYTGEAYGMHIAYDPDDSGGRAIREDNFEGNAWLVADFGSDTELGSIELEISGIVIYDSERRDADMYSTAVLTLTSSLSSQENDRFTGTTSMEHGGIDFGGLWGARMFDGGELAATHPNSIAGTFGASTTDEEASRQVSFIGFFGVRRLGPEQILQIVTGDAAARGARTRGSEGSATYALTQSSNANASGRTIDRVSVPHYLHVTKEGAGPRVIGSSSYMTRREGTVLPGLGPDLGVDHLVVEDAGSLVGSNEGTLTLNLIHIHEVPPGEMLDNPLDIPIGTPVGDPQFGVSGPADVNVPEGIAERFGFVSYYVPGPNFGRAGTYSCTTDPGGRCRIENGVAVEGNWRFRFFQPPLVIGGSVPIKYEPVPIGVHWPEFFTNQISYLGDIDETLSPNFFGTDLERNGRKGLLLCRRDPGGRCTLTAGVPTEGHWYFRYNDGDASEPVITGGSWLYLPNDANLTLAIEIGSFATSDDLFTGGNVRNLILDDAVYTGAAHGIYVRTFIAADDDGDFGDSGDFAGKAELRAHFGLENEFGTISGSITDIVLDGSDSFALAIELGHAPLTPALGGTFHGTTGGSHDEDGDADTAGIPYAGSWSGQLYGNGRRASIPPARAAGTFGAASLLPSRNGVRTSFSGFFGALNPINYERVYQGQLIAAARQAARKDTSAGSDLADESRADTVAQGDRLEDDFNVRLTVSERFVFDFFILLDDDPALELNRDDAWGFGDFLPRGAAPPGIAVQAYDLLERVDADLDLTHLIYVGDADDWIVGGFWLNLPSNILRSEQIEIGAYADGKVVFPQAQIASSRGRALYAGDIYGSYVSEFESADAAGDYGRTGTFTARAVFTADFEAAGGAGSITGVADQFLIDGAADSDLASSVSLGAARFGAGSDSLFQGNTTASSDSVSYTGKWSGRFYSGQHTDRYAQTLHPQALAGTFGFANSDYDNGIRWALVGSFAARTALEQSFDYRIFAAAARAATGISSASPTGELVQSSVHDDDGASADSIRVLFGLVSAVAHDLPNVTTDWAHSINFTNIGLTYLGITFRKNDGWQDFSFNQNLSDRKVTARHTVLSADVLPADAYTYLLLPGDRSNFFDRPTRSAPLTSGDFETNLNNTGRYYLVRCESGDLGCTWTNNVMERGALEVLVSKRTDQQLWLRRMIVGGVWEYQPTDLAQDSRINIGAYVHGQDLFDIDNLRRIRGTLEYSGIGRGRWTAASVDPSEVQSSDPDEFYASDRFFGDVSLTADFGDPITGAPGSISGEFIVRGATGLSEIVGSTIALNTAQFNYSSTDGTFTGSTEFDETIDGTRHLAAGNWSVRAYNNGFEFATSRPTDFAGTFGVHLADPDSPMTVDIPLGTRVTGSGVGFSRGALTESIARSLASRGGAFSFVVGTLNGRAGFYTCATVGGGRCRLSGGRVAEGDWQFNYDNPAFENYIGDGFKRISLVGFFGARTRAVDGGSDDEFLYHEALASQAEITTINKYATGDDFSSLRTSNIDSSDLSTDSVSISVPDEGGDFGWIKLDASSSTNWDVNTSSFDAYTPSLRALDVPNLSIRREQGRSLPGRLTLRANAFIFALVPQGRLEIIDGELLPADFFAGSTIFQPVTPDPTQIHGAPFRGEDAFARCSTAPHCEWTANQPAVGSGFLTYGVSEDIYGGAWLTLPTNNIYDLDDIEVGTFAGGDDRFSSDSLASVNNTVMYEGLAQGFYIERSYVRNAVNRYGRQANFEGKLLLNATFADGSQTVSGTISDILVDIDGSEELYRSMVINLGEATSTQVNFSGSLSATNVVLALPTDSVAVTEAATDLEGTWSGEYYRNGDTASDVPLGVAGTFTAGYFGRDGNSATDSYEHVSFVGAFGGRVPASLLFFAAVESATREAAGSTPTDATDASSIQSNGNAQAYRYSAVSTTDFTFDGLGIGHDDFTELSESASAGGVRVYELEQANTDETILTNLYHSRRLNIVYDTAATIAVPFSTPINAVNGDYGNSIELAGSYLGEAGKFVCTVVGTDRCRIAGNQAVPFTGQDAANPSTWLFEPTDGSVTLGIASTSTEIADTDWISFGAFQSLPTNQTQTDDIAVGAFANGDDEFTAANIAGLESSATYLGLATGFYADRQASEHGPFKALAVLEVDFGSASEAGSVSGTIDNFLLAGRGYLPMELSLSSAAIGTSSAGGFLSAESVSSASVTGVAWAGEWGARLFGNGDAATDHPAFMAGTFGAADDAATASLVGAFGTHLSATQDELYHHQLHSAFADLQSSIVNASADAARTRSSGRDSNYVSDTSVSVSVVDRPHQEYFSFTATDSQGNQKFTHILERLGQSNIVNSARLSGLRGSSGSAAVSQGTATFNVYGNGFATNAHDSNTLEITADPASYASYYIIPAGPPNRQLAYNTSFPMVFNGQGANGSFCLDVNGCTITNNRLTAGTIQQPDIFGDNPNTQTIGSDWLSGGVWMILPDDTADHDLIEVGAFATGDAPIEKGALEGFIGSVSYAGDAAGLWTRSLADADFFGNHQLASGRFEGNADLTAEFGTDSELGTISGSISSIRVGNTAVDAILSAYTLTLEEAAIDNTDQAAEHFSGGISVSGQDQISGSYSGSFYGSVSNDSPKNAAGTFGITNLESDENGFKISLTGTILTDK